MGGWLPWPPRSLPNHFPIELVCFCHAGIKKVSGENNGSAQQWDECQRGSLPPRRLNPLLRLLPCRRSPDYRPGNPRVSAEQEANLEEPKLTNQTPPTESSALRNVRMWLRAGQDIEQVSPPGWRTPPGRLLRGHRRLSEGEPDVETPRGSPSAPAPPPTSSVPTAGLRRRLVEAEEDGGKGGAGR